ncbi:catechol O-methyltransferase [Sarotherodon galilaeus]
MVERESSCLNSVWSDGWPTLGSVAPTLKPHKMEDFYVTDHELTHSSLSCPRGLDSPPASGSSPTTS